MDRTRDSESEGGEAEALDPYGMIPGIAGVAQGAVQSPVSVRFFIRPKALLWILHLWV